MTLQITLILLLILANGLLAMAEIAILTARKTHLKQLAQNGNKRAQNTLNLAQAPTHLLSTIQSGITLISILAGALGGAELAKHLHHHIQTLLQNNLPTLAQHIDPYTHPITLTLTVILITYTTLILGEMIPKRLALHAPEKTAMTLAQPIHQLSKLISPIIRLTSWTTDTLLNTIGIKKPPQETTITPEEIQLILEQGTHTGHYHRAESGMVKAVMNLDEEQVSDLMTPRPKIIWLNTDDHHTTNWRKIVTSNHSHFPLYQNNRDNIIGIISIKAIWANTAAGIQTNLKNLALPPLIVPETMPAVKLLETFKQTRKHIALVTDEFGSVTGLITLIDLLEAIVGDIPTEEEKHQEPYHQRPDGSYLIDAMMEADDLQNLLHLKTLPNQTTDDYHSAGGFALSILGHIPTEGDTFQHENYQFEIIDMDRHRIDKILATPQPKPTTPPTNQPNHNHQNQPHNHNNHNNQTT